MHLLKLTSALLAVSSATIVVATGTQNSVSTVLALLKQAMKPYGFAASPFNTLKAGAYTFGAAGRTWGVAGYLTKAGSPVIDGINFDGSAPMNMVVLPPIFDAAARFIGTWCGWKNEDDIVRLLISEHFTAARRNTDSHTLLPTEMPQIHVAHVGTCTVASTVTDFGGISFQPSFYVRNVGGTVVAPPGAVKNPVAMAVKPAAKSPVPKPVAKPVAGLSVPATSTVARPVTPPPIPPASSERDDSHVSLVYEFKVQGRITATAVNLDGTLLAIGHGDGTLGLLDVQGRRLKFSVAVQPRSAYAYPGVGSVVFPEKGDAVLVATMDGPVRLFDLKGKILGSFPANDDEPSRGTPALAITPDGTQFAFNQGASTITKIWDIPGNRQVGSTFIPGQELAYIQGGTRVVISTGVHSQTIDPSSPVPLEFTDATAPLRFSKASSLMASGWKGDPTVVVLTDLASGEEQRLPVGHLSDLAFSPDGQLLAVLDGEEITLRRTDDGSEVLTFHPGEQVPSALYFGKDSTELLTVQNGSVRLWKLPQ